MDLSTAFLPVLLLLFVGMMFLSSRKQRKQVQETQQMQSHLVEGEVVMTTSGLRGTIMDASYEDTVDLEIAPGVVTTWLRAAVRERVNPVEEPSSEEENSSGPALPDESADAATRDRPNS